MRATASWIRASVSAPPRRVFSARDTVMADTPASAATSFSVVPPVPRRGVRVASRSGADERVAGDAVEEREDEGTMPDVNANPMRTGHHAATAYSFYRKAHTNWALRACLPVYRLYALSPWRPNAKAIATKGITSRPGWSDAGRVPHAADGGVGRLRPVNPADPAP